MSTTCTSPPGPPHHDKERYLYAPAKSGLGWHVYTPLEGAPSQVVSINRGFVPDERKDPASRREGQLPGEVEVTGLVRAAPPAAHCTPANDAVTHDLWYWPDASAMHASAFAGTGVRALPFTVDANTPGKKQPESSAAQRRHRLDLPNRHLEYALTWYGLALTLIVLRRFRCQPAALGQHVIGLRLPCDVEMTDSS